MTGCPNDVCTCKSGYYITGTSGTQDASCITGSS